jgi:hypothetical protein
MSRLLLAIALCAPLPALAADAPRAELFGGYSYTRNDGASLHGWTGALAYNLGRSFGLEASASGHYGSAGGTDTSQTSLLLGPRLARRGETFTPFLHALGGLVRSSEGIDVFEVSIRQHETDPGGVLGAGLDVAIGRRWAVRLQGDYTFTKAELETRTEPRAAIGIVYRAGAR